METKPLIGYFNNILPLNEAETSFVEKAYKARRIRKEFILQEGDASKHGTFIGEGCFRTFLVE